MRPGMPLGWPGWEPAFAHDLVHWAGVRAWQPGPGDVSWAELALDQEAFIGRALLASANHKVRGTRLPLGEKPRCCATQRSWCNGTWRRDGYYKKRPRITAAPSSRWAVA